MVDEVLKHIRMLLHLGGLGAMFREVKTSTVAIAGKVGGSQQSVSRNLYALERSGLISREAAPNGVKVMLTQKGREGLIALKEDLDSLLVIDQRELLGVVVSGLGEGKYYVTQEGYQSRFRKELGFTAYPGTLNLKVDEVDLRRFLYQKEMIHIDGFEAKGRTFGSLKGIKVIIRKGKKKAIGCMILPKRTNHPKSIIELISADSLRARFSLADGDSVEVMA